MEGPWLACYRGISADITAAQKKACSDHASEFREHDLDGRGREVQEWQIAPGVVDRHSHAQETERLARCRPFGCTGPSARLRQRRSAQPSPAVVPRRLPALLRLGRSTAVICGSFRSFTQGAIEL